jgi:hypothetical protein
MTEIFDIGEDIYQFIDKIPLEKENIKELIEYVHYKALLDSFTFIIENNKEGNLDFLLPDYVEVLSKIQISLLNIKNKYEKNGKK